MLTFILLGLEKRTEGFGFGLKGIKRFYSSSNSQNDLKKGSTLTSTTNSKGLGLGRDMDFHFPTPRPSEILYQNLDAVRNRLRLFSLYRMKRQLALDLEGLRKLRVGRNWNRTIPPPFTTITLAPPSTPNDDSWIQIETQLHFKPGLKEPNFTQGATNCRAKLTFQVKSALAHYSPKVRHRLRLLSGSRYTPATDRVCLESTRFPFLEQNQKYLTTVLRRLVEAAVSHPLPFETLKLRQVRTGPQKRSTRKAYLLPPPPLEWYQQPS